jgi:hypothetical protein
VPPADIGLLTEIAQATPHDVPESYIPVTSIHDHTTLVGDKEFERSWILSTVALQYLTPSHKEAQVCAHEVKRKL